MERALFLTILNFTTLAFITQASASAQKPSSTEYPRSAQYQLLVKNAEAGDAKAQVYLGRLYEQGGFLPQDYTEAMDWFKKAAGRGSADAENQLGQMYFWGLGVDKDRQQALQWFQKSADSGNAGGQMQVGEMYADGTAGRKDPKEALKWYLKAAEQGNRQAAVLVGMAYKKGEGVQQDSAEAERWFNKADAGMTSANVKRIGEPQEVYQYTIRANTAGHPEETENAKFVFSRANIASWIEMPNGVSITLTHEGAKNLNAITRANLGKKMDFYIETWQTGKAVRINEPLEGSHLDITFEPAERRQIVSKLPSDKEARSN